MGKDGHRADQTGHVRGNPSDDTLPDLWCVADIFLPQEKGALVVRLLGVAPPHSRRGSGPPARPTWEMCPTRGFYSLTYSVRPYSSAQPRPSYAGRTIPCGDISMWTGILCRTWQTIVYKGARSGGQNGNPGNNVGRQENSKR